MSRTTAARLAKKYKAWRKDPILGFVAKPMKRANGTLDYLNYECWVKGKEGTLWEKGYYRVLLMFSKEYPNVPPDCKFEPPIFHPNVHPSTGVFDLPMFDKNKRCAPTTGFKQILLCIQNFLNEAAVARLAEEYKAWPKNPVLGFVAQPMKQADGTLDYRNFECWVRGKGGTPWELGYYRVRLMFPEEYPSLPPDCKFEPPIFHPNVHPSTGVCHIPILDKNKAWTPNVTIMQILRCIQNFLNEPDIEGLHKLNRSACIMYRHCQADYKVRVRMQAMEMCRRAFLVVPNWKLRKCTLNKV